MNARRLTKQEARDDERRHLTGLDVENVKRLKRGLSTTHPLRGDEVRVLKAWLTERQRMKPEGKALFVSERRQPLNRKTAWVIIRDYGKDARLGVASHPHMLRHACGFALPIKARIRGLFKITWGIEIYNTRCNTRLPIPCGLNGCGGRWEFYMVFICRVGMIAKLTLVRLSGALYKQVIRGVRGISAPITIKSEPPPHPALPSSLAVAETTADTQRATTPSPS